jgi:hypothetical protein
MKKRLLALALTGIIMTAPVGVFAQDNGSLYIDGQLVASTVTEDNKIMVPVRDAATALGYEVEWIAASKTVTLTKGAVYITFTIGTDGYTFARTAPMPLGKAAEIKNGTTYAPLELFTELMELDASIDEGDVNIVTVSELKGSGVVTESTDGTISFEDSVMGEVLLHIGENTEITDSEGNAVSLADITEDSELEVVYGDAMMDSLPPQNNPKSITVLSLAEKQSEEYLTIKGEVTELEDGLMHVVSEDENALYPEVALVITDKTEGDGVNAVVGDKVEATFSYVMTRSIPPQSNAFTINKVK